MPIARLCDRGSKIRVKAALGGQKQKRKRKKGKYLHQTRTTTLRARGTEEGSLDRPLSEVSYSSTHLESKKES